MVEFALVAPVLFLLLFGVIEMGWGFYQSIDVRHGAREGVRLAAVNADPTNAGSTQQERLANELCARMDLDGEVEIEIQLDRTLVAPSDSAQIGDEVEVVVRKELDQLTGVLGPFLDDIVIESAVSTRLEVSPTYGDLAPGAFTC